MRYRSGDSWFLVYASQFAGTNQATAAAFEADDLTALAAHLRGAGVEFEEYDFDEFKTVDGIVSLPDGSAAAWFKDHRGQHHRAVPRRRLNGAPADLSCRITLLPPCNLS